MKKSNQPVGREGDADLGMRRAITRRDFINGVATTVGATLACPLLSGTSAQAADTQVSEHSPPALTGIRGTAPGSFQIAHGLRDGGPWNGAAVDSHESYDLVVVGAGVSGLSAAHFYRQFHGAKARILLLEPQDDFGGHARRNEFRLGAKRLIGYGGSEQLYPGPAAFSPDARGLLTDLGVDTTVFRRAFDQSLYRSLGLQEGLFFDQKTFGKDQLVTGEGVVPWGEFLARTPLAASVQADLLRLYTQPTDYFAGFTVEQKLSRLERLSYAEYLLTVVKVDAAVLPYFNTRFHRLEVVGADATPALSAWLTYQMPGFDGLGLPSDPAAQLAIARRAGGLAWLEAEMNDMVRRAGSNDAPDIFHFPDGNASIARLLVRSLIPDAVPGHDMNDIVTSQVRYPALDQRDSSVRIRLGSTAVRVQNIANPGGQSFVDVVYAKGGAMTRVRARHCVLACYQAMIPFLCPELPTAQREVMHEYGVRAPLVYTNVLLANWRSWHKLGIHHVHALNGYHTEVKLDFPVSLGSYTCARTPDEPIVLHLEKSMVKPGLSRRNQHRAGRGELLATDFRTFEREIRSQLADILGPGGFDPARDIKAITVNRWPHGYASFGRDSLVDPNWSAGQTPWDLARQPFGRVTIACSDAGPMPLLQCAIDQALRAVKELPAA